MNLQTYLKDARITQREFADSIGVTQGLIHQWLAGIRRISAERVLPVAKATGWKVTPHDLRPDLYPDPDWLPPGTPDRAA